MSEMPDFEHTFAVDNDVKDWISASWLVTRRRWLWRRLLLTVALVWVFYTLLMTVPDALSDGLHMPWILNGMASAAKWTAILILVIAGTMAISLPWRVKRLFRQAANLPQSTEFSFNAEEFRSVNAVSTTRLEWSKFRRWHENSRVLVLVVMERSYFILPKSRIAAETLDALRRHLIAADVAAD